MPLAAVREVVAEVAVEPPNVIVVEYRIRGDLERLRIPLAPTRLDPERLWAHTCGELFVAPGSGEAYVEWNFSSTGQHAVFAFSSYRRRADATALDAEVFVAVEPDALHLRARAPLPPSIGPSARVSLTAVVEDAAGALSYWALVHPLPQPDFHHRDGFALSLTLGRSPVIVGASPEPS